MRQRQYAGEKLFVDYAGATVPIYGATCRSARYRRVPRLFQEIQTCHGDGSYLKLLKRLAKTPILILDDWGVIPLSTQDRADLLEILDDRINTRSTII